MLISRFQPIFAAVFLLIIASPVFAGAPLKGVDVKLGRNPGGGAAARTSTDGAGKFNFPAQPAGSYSLSFGLPFNANVVVNVKAGSASITREFHTTPAANARMASGERRLDLDLKSTAPISGTVETAVVKAKSNISNN